MKFEENTSKAFHDSKYLYKMILSKIKEFVKAHIDTIMLIAIVMLFVLLSFAFGYIIAKYQDRKPIQIEVRK
ncbi:MAG: hypothetical protein A2908_04635 [Candidatus Staskawiczbacteria bacterium RIFCSPLOWO2_01_FULL_38_12b]|uniref:Uncharacterized protein n=1 Tax=Candidatus Staskawiczbacteria bacterium RIFCSPLOWO2_01_FULL_38_12b TaxID=1802214 RepID=A0A1G2IDW4_9BACT|nr:MAG: hypothetical protein A2908_04635 [Candidatus Staskawiczbacteria bacterium RIFCSPLOWO2_01_FULL_38_12b]